MRTAASLILAFLLAETAMAATYYIATDGDDSHDGLSTGEPWKTLTKAGSTMDAGDCVFIRGGVYDMAGSAGYQYFGLGKYHGTGHSGTPSSPIVVSNYPNEIPQYINCNPAGSGVGPIAIGNTAWVKIFGLFISNSQVRTVEFYNVTNCELAYCTIIDSATNAHSSLLTLGDGAKSNYVHHNVVTNNHNKIEIEIDDLGDIGSTWNYPETNGCNWNVIASNTFFYGQHAVMVAQGNYNVFRGNTYHNEPWMYWGDYQQYLGHRNMGVWADSCWFDGESYLYAGQPGANDGATGIEVMGAFNVIRRCVAAWNENYGVLFYDKGVTQRLPNSNIVYHSTFAYNGLGQMYVTNYTTETTNNLTASKSMMAFNSATNTVIKNCLFAFNGAQSGGDATNAVHYHSPATEAKQTWGLNVTNSVQGDPKFVQAGSDYKLTGNYHLQVGSSAIDAGTWLTTVTSDSGSGTSVNVADARYFFGGTTASGTVFPGDTIQLQGQTATATITGISGNTLTLDKSLTWTSGLGVALTYSGAAPDAGAYEYSASTNYLRATTARAGTVRMR